MIAPTCTPFSYKNFQENDISEISINPSLWDRLQLNSNRIKVDLIYCDTIQNLPSKSGGNGEPTCSRKITTSVLQNFKPLQKSIDLGSISKVQEIMNEGYEKLSEEIVLRKTVIKTPCFKWELNGNEYVKGLADVELYNSDEYKRIQSLYNNIGLAALALMTSSVIAFGIYKWYRRYNQPATINDKVNDREKLLIQFKPKALPTKLPHHRF